MDCERFEFPAERFQGRDLNFRFDLNAVEGGDAAFRKVRHYEVTFRVTVCELKVRYRIPQTIKKESHNRHKKVRRKKTVPVMNGRPSASRLDARPHFLPAVLLRKLPETIEPKPSESMSRRIKL